MGLCTLRMLVMNTGVSCISDWQGILAASNRPVNFAEMIEIFSSKALIDFRDKESTEVSFVRLPNIRWYQSMG